MPPQDRNRLDAATSPYLLQHKDNPVHWWPWTDAAFAAARARDVPILLSVGYSACHWCHVMAHECFDDENIAAAMNKDFVSIKVDREERPDVDAIYQKALALMGEQGGWPLTMFILPNGKPFFGGTYFPPTPAYGRPGLPEVLAHVSRLWRERRPELLEHGDAMTASMVTLKQERLRDGLALSLLDDAALRLLDYVDLSSGGMTGAPKFPMPFVFDFLWRAHLRTNDHRCFTAVLTTLRHMCEGGIYDHLGGGFARYSTDADWLVPHFEKMLYDNAQLIDLMTQVWQKTQLPLLAQRIHETIAWLCREMTGENGAFVAAFDADSEGEEGKFYVWDASEIDDLLGAEAVFFKAAYGVTPDGNWDGKNILNRSHRAVSGFTPEDDARLAPARRVLADARARRVPPARDDKVLADWNGLVITALVRAGLAFNASSWLSRAQTAFAGICETMTWSDDDGRARLGHSFCRGQLQVTGMLDDYANMINAALALSAATGDDSYLQRAEAWIDSVNALYWDDSDGGYFFTANDANDLITRTKSAVDSAVPSGNGAMVFALARAFHLTGQPAHRARALSTLDALEVDAFKNFPHGTTLLNAFEFLESAVQVVIIGDRDTPATQALLKTVHGMSLPNLVLNVIAPGKALPDMHPAHGKTAVNDQPMAYVCRGPVCSVPHTSPATLALALTASD